MLTRPTIPDPFESWLREKEIESAQRLAALREAGQQLIAESRASIRPRLQQVLAECEADYLQGDYEMVGTIQSSEWGD